MVMRRKLCKSNNQMLTSNKSFCYYPTWHKIRRCYQISTGNLTKMNSELYNNYNYSNNDDNDDDNSNKDNNHYNNKIIFNRCNVFVLYKL